MVTVKCEKTGIEFEAATRRAKNHPTVQAWMSKAREEGWYTQANNAIYGTRMLNYTDKVRFATIEEFVAYFEQLRFEAMQANAAEAKAKSDRERAEKEARRQRYVTNDLLRGHGYTWRKFVNDEEDVDMLGLPAYEWTLYSPDHRVVTTQEAMQELAFTGVKFAKEWLAERSIAEQLPAIEVKRREEAAKVEAEQSLTDEQLEYQAEAVSVLIEAGLSQEQAETEAMRLSLPHSPAEDVVILGSAVMLPDGREVTPVINGDLRYGFASDHSWLGITEVLDEYPDIPGYQRFLEYARRNEVSR